MSTQIIIGDCREKLREIEAGTLNCCVTSPPYFGLRDYGHGEQIGLEASPDAYVAELVEVFREVRRVLRDDGTLWLNLGDSYNAGRDGGHAGGQKQASHPRHEGVNRSGANVPGLKPKDLIGIPWRVAFALQADGWYLRQDIIWHKPNPMPESVTDRCTKAHEYVFLLSKSEQYRYDADAIKEHAVGGARTRNLASNFKKAGSHSHGKHTSGGAPEIVCDGSRNKRSVWTVASQPYAEAHFATFPPKLIEPCILAGCPVGGTVLDTFGGSGTTALVAIEHHRNAVLCELNPQYAKLIERRVRSAQPRLFS